MFNTRNDSPNGNWDWAFNCMCCSLFQMASYNADNVVAAAGEDYCAEDDVGLILLLMLNCFW